MTELTQIVVVGAQGRMGTEILQLAAEDEAFHVAGAISRRPGATVAGTNTSSDLAAALVPPAVLIDFTTPEVLDANLATARSAGCPVVVGTTGLTDAHHAALDEASATIPVLYAANTSVGINVMSQLVALAAGALGDGYDIELLEAHHRRKVDAPSGTALRLLEVLCDVTGRSAANYRHTRHGRTGARTDREIGVQVLRGGDVAGEHTVFFMGDGERLEITHRASSRRVFARGALRAAAWLGEPQRAPGRYTMADVLGQDV